MTSTGEFLRWTGEAIALLERNGFTTTASALGERLSEVLRAPTGGARRRRLATIGHDAARGGPLDVRFLVRAEEADRVRYRRTPESALEERRYRELLDRLALAPS